MVDNMKGKVQCKCGTVEKRRGPRQTMCEKCAAASKVEKIADWKAKKAEEQAQEPGSRAHARQQTLKKIQEKSTPSAAPVIGTVLPEKSDVEKRSIARLVAERAAAANPSPDRQGGDVCPPATPTVGPAVALLAPMRTILEALSAHHGLIAQRALAADNALASLQEVMG